MAESVERLLMIAPELAFTFRVSLTVEGKRPSPDVLAWLNEVLDEIQAGWELLQGATADFTKGRWRRRV